MNNLNQFKKSRYADSIESSINCINQDDVKLEEDIESENMVDVEDEKRPRKTLAGQFVVNAKSKHKQPEIEEYQLIVKNNANKFKK